VGRTEGRNEMEDCANANPVEQNDLGELAQLRPTAAGLERSAAHPAIGDQQTKKVIAQRWP